MTKYQYELYKLILNEIQAGITFNQLVTKCFATVRRTGDEKLLGKVDRMDIRAGITRLSLYGAININHREITHNLDGSLGIHEYLEKL